MEIYDPPIPKKMVDPYMVKVLIGLKKSPSRNIWFRHRLQICIFSGLDIEWWSKLLAGHPYPTQIWVPPLGLKLINFWVNSCLGSAEYNWVETGRGHKIYHFPVWYRAKDHMSLWGWGARTLLCRTFIHNIQTGTKPEVMVSKVVICFTQYWRAQIINKMLWILNVQASWQSISIG